MLPIPVEIILGGFALWVGVLGVYDWLYRSAKRKMFVPIFVFAGLMLIWDILNPNTYGAAIFQSAFLTVLLILLSGRFKVGVVVRHVENGDIDSSVSKGISDGDVYVLIGLVWVVIGLPAFIVLGASFGLTFLYEWKVGKFTPYVTMLALSLLVAIPLMLLGVLK